MSFTVDDRFKDDVAKYRWYKDQHYWSTNHKCDMGSKPIRLHKFIYNLANLPVGFCPCDTVWADNGYDIDHIDFDTSNNCLYNLRLLPRQENKCRKKPKGTSHYNGVSKFRNKWKATIKLDGKTYHIGVFPTEVEAALAYNAYVEQNNIPCRVINVIPTFKITLSPTALSGLS